MNMLRCSWLIYLAMRTYATRLIIIVAIMFIPAMATFSRGGTNSSEALILVSLLGFIPGLWVLYTFYMWEKAPRLFLVLPQRRLDFVRAVYFNYLVLTVGTLAMDVVAYFMVQHYGRPPAGFFFPLALVVAGIVVLISIAIPLAFKLGYAKIQAGLLVPIFIPVLMTPLSRFLSHVTIFQSLVGHLVRLSHTTLMAGMVMLAGAALIVSYNTATRTYLQKDF